ncbi:predicted protein [Naegleria gruberi]|uniref:Predicted protein n=1 Tax=Naegleria gruberi TaxID=5762 RepID=D2VV72_NAEGR|nr:uncharacterized protein NAEGRDRAFT_72913 [Naegleria gruberi]EFC39258.1 predicted protein [Naegleria gruberi]|eukprot:XP_002672002.1 predicted protein [Naegleria gruberi strain NEG-M]
MNFNCSDLCIDSGSGVWDNKTSIYDWINYCQYCRNANGFEKYHQLRLGHSCNNTKLIDSRTRIVDIIESIPNDIRYCGTVNIGIPLVVGPLMDSYAIVCYCEKHNRFEFECVKHGWENILKESLDFGGLIVFSLLFIVTISLLLIPKSVNYFKKVPGFTILRLIPSLALTFSSLCYIVNYSLYFTPSFAVATTFLMMAQLMQFYSLFPIVMRWYGMATLINQNQQGKPNNYSIKKVYIIAVILFFIAVLFVCFVTVAIPLLIGDQYFLYTYVAISWLSEVLCLSMFIITSRRVNSVLKKLSDIVSNTVPFIKLSNFSILFVLVISFIDLNGVFAKLVNDRVFLAYTQILTDVLYCILFCRIVIFDFDYEDFKIFKKQTNDANGKIEEIKQELSVTTNSHEHETSNSSSSSYYLLDN